MHYNVHLRQLIFLRKSDCLGCTVLLCLVVCLTLLASSFFLHLSNMIVYLYTSVHSQVPSLPSLQVGTVWVNCWLVRDLNVPFGGAKMSGVGREGLKDSLEFYTEVKTVCIKH